MASNVPRFTSFRPKPKEPEQAAREPPHLKESSKSKTFQQEEDKEKERRKEKDRSKTGSRQEQEVRHPVHDTAPSKVFFSDRRGDKDIAKYGTTNKYAIPAYRVYGYGRILGISLNRRIDRDRSTENEVVITPPQGPRQRRVLADRHALRADSRAIRFIKTTINEADPNADFISLSATGKRRRVASEDDEGVDEYRRLDRHASAAKPLDLDAEYESETVAPYDIEITQQNAALIRRTRDFPEDLDAWISLIDHQEAMLKIDRSSSELSTYDKQNLADVRISTYEQALKKITKDEASRTKLYAGLMKEASRYWDERRLARKWTEILIEFPKDEQLWTQYLNFVQSSFTSFKFENCRNMFLKCFRAIQGDADREQTDFVLHILVRVSSMIQQAGYLELALAVWQALLELHLFKPKVLLGKALEETLQSFEVFWDSETARIGEEGATGWRSFNEETPLLPATRPEPLEVNVTLSTVTGGFWQRELENVNKLRYPGRTFDEVGEDDPFHTILFSDVEAFLQLVPQNIRATSLLNGFLFFCQLPHTLQKQSDLNRYRLDPFLRSSIQSSSATPSVDHDGIDTFAQILKRYSSCPLQNWRVTTDLLFNDAFPKTLDIVNADFLRRLLKLLATSDPEDESLGEYLLAFEANYFPSEAHRTAKKLLKARPSSLRLYNAYGLSELRRGNFAKADQVFGAALSMQMGNLTFATSGSLELFSNWVWEALHRGQGEEALLRLVSPTGKIPDGARPEQVALLRSRAVFNELTERSLLGNELSAAVISTSLSALLAYLAGGGEIADSALSLHENLTKWFTDHNLLQSPTSELHAQSIARFLKHHATHAHIVKPSLIRKSLEPLISSFPNNTILLSLYAANEARFSIDDRVRDVMHRNSLETARDSSIVHWTFSIYYEALRGEIVGSTAHSIRELFVKAEDDVGAQCPALWKQHILFEIAEVRKERAKRPIKQPTKDGKKRKDDLRADEAYEKVKEVFFRGVTHLPWCKDFMMMAFTHLGQEFLSEEELRKVYNVMVEKELRLYVEIEGGSA